MTRSITVQLLPDPSHTEFHHTALGKKGTHMYTEDMEIYRQKRMFQNPHESRPNQNIHMRTHTHTYTAPISMTVVHTGMHLHTERKVKHWSMDIHTRCGEKHGK